MAVFSVSLQCSTEKMSEAASHAYIIFTVLQVCLWVNDSMTFAERPVLSQCDEPTMDITPPDLHQSVVTMLTPTHTVISALSVFHWPWHLPASPKGHSPFFLGTGGCDEIILWVAIKVSTKTTSLAGIFVRQRDHKTVFPVITDSQTEISLNDHRAAALEHNQLVVVQGYWQTPQTVFNLHKRKCY